MGGGGGGGRFLKIKQVRYVLRLQRRLSKEIWKLWYPKMQAGHITRRKVVRMEVEDSIQASEA